MPDPLNLKAAEELIQERPPLHDFVGRGELTVGGMTGGIARRLIKEIQELDKPHIMETGAGISTLLFCCLAPERVTSIAPDEQLWERISAEADTRGIDLSPVRKFRERSDVALPPLAAAGESIDVAFVDGDHGWPSVFVDFCYMNMMLREGGLLFLDDTHVHSVHQLQLLLVHQPGFSYTGDTQKMAVFRKDTADRFLPLASQQPFIRANTVKEPRGPAVSPDAGGS